MLKEGYKGIPNKCLLNRDSLNDFTYYLVRNLSLNGDCQLGFDDFKLILINVLNPFFQS